MDVGFGVEEIVDKKEGNDREDGKNERGVLRSGPV